MHCTQPQILLLIDFPMHLLFGRKKKEKSNVGSFELTQLHEFNIQDTELLHSCVFSVVGMLVVNHGCF